MKNAFKLIVFKPKIVLFITLILCVCVGAFSVKLEIDASTQTLLLEDDKDLAIWREVSKRYETPNFLVIAYTPKGDLLSKQSLETIKDLSQKLEKIDGINKITSILNVPLLANKPIGVSEFLEHVPTLNDENIDLEAAKREFLTSPLYKNALVSSDFKTTSIVVQLNENKKYSDYVEKINELKQKDLNEAQKKDLANLQKEFKNYRDELRIIEHKNIQEIKDLLKSYGDEKLFLGGLNMISNDMIDYVKKDLMQYGLSVCVLLVFCLWLFFRQVRFVLLPVFVCVLSAVVASGIFGLLGYEITVISSNYTALQLIITVSLMIHLIVGYRELYFLHESYTQKQLVYLTLKSRAKPCFFAIFTTVIGFASLIFSDIRPIISLGIMMSVSISISLIIGFVMFGSIMSLIKKTRPKRSFERSFSFTKYCAKLVMKNRKIIYVFSIIVVVIGVYGISKLKVENSFIGYFKQNTDIYKGMEVIDKNLGGTIPLDVTIKFKNKITQNTSNDDLDDFENEFSTDDNDPKYWFSTYKLDIIKKTDAFLQKQNFVGNVGSLATLLNSAKSLNGGRELDSLALAMLYKELNDEYKKILLNPYVSIENNEVHFSIRTIDSDPNLRRDEFIKKLRSDLEKFLSNDEVEVQVSGIMILYNNMLQSLITSQINTLGIVLLALFVTFIFIFKSIKFAIIAIISNIIPLCGVFGIMGIFGINLDIMSITIAAISLGIGVDDIIHYIHRFKLELLKKSLFEAIKASHLSIGYAMYYTSFAIFLGFSVMVTSNFWPTIYFGLLTDLVMILMLLGALLLLPALIISFSNKIKQVI